MGWCIYGGYLCGIYMDMNAYVGVCVYVCVAAGGCRHRV